MLVLVACEVTQIVTRAFRERGHEAYSCDVLPTEGNPDWHYQCDVREMQDWAKVDLLIAHPPCQYLALSGLHWNYRIPGRMEKTTEALGFVRWLMELPINKIAIENPVGAISSRIRKPDQLIQPWQFGHPESKLTCLWLKNLPNLQPTNILTPARFQTSGQPRWDNQTATGQNRLGPSSHRSADRARTYKGIAEAMADQWSTENTPDLVGQGKEGEGKDD